MFQRVKFYAKAYPIITGYTFGIILNLVMFIIGKTNFPKFLSESIISMVSIAALILPIEINRKYVIIYNKPLDITVYLLIDYAIVIFGFAAWQGLNDYNNIRYYHTTKDNIIYISEKKIVSTSTYYLIGKTKKYLFFYDEKKELATVYPNTNVTEMIIKNDTY